MILAHTLTLAHNEKLVFWSLFSGTCCHGGNLSWPKVKGFLLTMPSSGLIALFSIHFANFHICLLSLFVFIYIYLPSVFDSGG
jgi:hypothetical protein